MAASNSPRLLGLNTPMGFRIKCLSFNIESSLRITENMKRVAVAAVTAKVISHTRLSRYITVNLVAVLEANQVGRHRKFS